MPIASHPRSNVNTSSIFHTLKVNSNFKIEKNQETLNFFIHSHILSFYKKIACITFRRIVKKFTKMNHRHAIEEIHLFILNMLPLDRKIFIKLSFRLINFIQSHVMCK